MYTLYTHLLTRIQYTHNTLVTHTYIGIHSYIEGYLLEGSNRGREPLKALGVQVRPRVKFCIQHEILNRYKKVGSK